MYCPKADFANAVATRADRWVPACNGTETAFRSRSGVRLLYVYNPATGRHAYLNADTDVVLTDAEAEAYLSR